MTPVRRSAALASLALLATACSVLDTTDDAPPTTISDAAAPTSTTTPVLPAAAAPTATTMPTTTVPLGPPRALVTPTGVVVPVRGGGPGAWIVGTPCHGEATVADGGPIHGVTVLIDPGHGGDDEPGAVGAGGLQEADLNLDVAWRLSAALAERGIDSLLTRPADYRIAVIARAELATVIQPEVFVSVHHNGGETVPREAPGVEVFHQSTSDGSRRLGGLVFEELMAAFEPLEADWVGGPLHGVSYRLNRDDEDLYGVLRRPVGVDTVLTEAMYLTNPSEEDLLDDPAVLDLEAEALATAIERFLTTDDPGTGFIDPTTFRGDLGSGGGTVGCEDPPLE
ncbi:MAG: N-acetylmuramoyl-L-alanine amidase [Actinomycetota bacterium]